MGGHGCRGETPAAPGEQDTVSLLSQARIPSSAWQDALRGRPIRGCSKSDCSPVWLMSVFHIHFPLVYQLVFTCMKINFVISHLRFHPPQLLS